MFFDDTELVERARCQLKVLPPIPETNWTAPKEYRDLSQAIFIGGDFEVKESDFDRGPGWSRGKASIVGGSLHAIWRDGSSYTEYRPIRHEVDTHLNCDAEQTVSYWRDIYHSKIPKCFANAQYDIGNATEESIYVEGEIHDCQFAEALLDDNAFVDLDTLGTKYLKMGKESNVLYEWCALAYGGKPTGTQRENIWRASPKLAGPYGMADARMPVEVIIRQWPLLQAADMLKVYRLECDLIRLMIRMRMQGVRIDLNKAVQMYEALAAPLANLYKQIKENTGIALESTTGKAIIKVFEALGIKLPLTDNGNPSVTAEWLKRLNHPIARIILDIRKIEIIRNTFLKAYLIEGNVNGIVHGEYHQLRNDEGGTKVGRFSSSNPNLTNIPSRVEKESEFGIIAKQVRECFIPFEGHSNWHKGDYSQLQYRILAHYAVGPGSDELRARYNNDPDADYHTLVQDMILRIAKREMQRRPVKNINFSIVMGGGMDALRRYLQEPDKVIKEIMAAYHLSAPYVKATMEHISGMAQRIGYVTSLDGRRVRYDLWEPVEVDWDNRAIPLPYEWAIKKYGSKIQRAKTHAAVSHMLQGGEGAIIKASILAAYQAGIFDVIGVPTMLVHDEGNWSQIDQSPRQVEAFRDLNRIMETTIPIRVPVKFKMETSRNWGDFKD